MKSEIIKTEKEQQIDWNKPQFVVSGGGTLIATNGKHEGEFFGGTLLCADSIYSFLPADRWLKDAFKLIPEDGITIKFTNE
jgi:hypothetical protein